MSDEESGARTTEEQKSEESRKAQEAAEKAEAAKEKIQELEENPPEKLEDWPEDQAKYETYGGAEEGEHSYEEGPEAKLGPSGLRHHEDGSVSIDGDEVDEPEKYKGEPIPGGPTDPEAKPLAGEKKLVDRDGESDEDGESQQGGDDESQQRGDGEREDEPD